MSPMTRSGVLIIRPWLSEREDFMGSPKNFSGEKPTQIGYHQGLFDLMLWECDFCWRHMLRALPFLVFRKSCPVQLCFQVIILLHRKEGEVVFCLPGPLHQQLLPPLLSWWPTFHFLQSLLSPFLGLISVTEFFLSYLILTSLTSFSNDQIQI